MYFRLAVLGIFAMVSFVSADTIQSITIKGSVYNSDSQIIKTMGVKKGDNLEDQDLAKLIQKLHQKHAYERVSMDFQKGHLVVNLKPSPKIASIKMNLVTGVSKEVAKQYLKSVNFEVGSFYSDEKLANVVRAFENAAMRAGYDDVEVKVNVDYHKGQSVTVEIDILTEDGYALSTLTFNGSSVFTSSELKQISGLNPTNLLSFLTSDDGVSDLKVLVAVSNIRQAYANHGYFDIAINKQLVRNDKDKTVTLVMNISEGKPTYIDSVELKGFSDKAIAKVKDLGVSKGSVLKRNLLLESEKVLERSIRDEGRPFSDVTLTVVSVGNNKVAIKAKQSRGKMLSVRFIKFIGNTKTKDKTLRRHFEIFEGGKFSQTKLDRAIRNLNDLTYIKSASEKIVRVKGTKQVDIAVEIVEESTAMISLQGSYDKQSGIIFSSQYNDQNFLGYGNHLQLDLQRALRGNQHYDISWHSPVSMFNSNWSESISAGYSRNYSSIKEDDASESSNRYFNSSLYFNIKEGISIAESWRYYVGAGLEFRSTNNAQAGTIAEAFINKFGQNYTQFSILNDLRYAAGYFNDLYGTWKGELSTVYVPDVSSKGLTYFKVQARVEQNVKIGEFYKQPFVFNPIFRAGYGRGLSDQMKTLPYYAKFRLGSSDMVVRGIDPTAAGPYYIYQKTIQGQFGQKFFVNKTDFAGADQFMGVNLSIWTPSPLPELITPGVYYDVTNFKTDEFLGSGVRYSYGLAFKFNSPMGLINLAYAFKTKTLGKDEPQKFWFSMSQEL